MSSSTSGVQARIKKEALLATYVHCNGHSLNPVISNSCALPQVRNVIERLKIAVVSYCPKRSGLLELIVKHNIANVGKEEASAGLVQDRMGRTATLHACQHFYPAFVFIVGALEMIGFKRHFRKYVDMYADCMGSSESQ